MTDEKEYVTLADAAAQLGIKRASLYYYIKRMQIKRHDFPLNRHAFISQADFQRIKAAKERPWELDDTAPRPVVRKEPQS